MIYIPKMQESKLKKTSVQKKKTTKGSRTAEQKKRIPDKRNNKDCGEKKSEDSSANTLAILKAFWSFTRPLVLRIFSKDKEMKEAFHALESSPLVTALINRILRTINSTSSDHESS